MALLDHPAPHQVRALASVLNNIFRDAPPTPASLRQQGRGPEGLDAVHFRCTAWYQRPAAGGTAGCPACSFREAVHLLAAGDERRDWYQAFGDLGLARLQAVGVLALARPILHALLSIIEPWV